MFDTKVYNVHSYHTAKVTIKPRQLNFIKKLDFPRGAWRLLISKAPFLLYGSLIGLVGQHHIETGQYRETSQILSIML